MVKGLNHFVSFNVNEVAAESQKSAALSEHESLEPGSNLWIARQAYFKLLDNKDKQRDAEDLRVLQARYKVLQQLIVEEQEKAPEDPNKKQVCQNKLPIKNICLQQVAQRTFCNIQLPRIRL